MEGEKQILFYDGYCNLCNRTIDFFSSRNKKGNLYFSSLQSEYASSFLEEKLTQDHKDKRLKLTSNDNEKFTTIYFYSNGEIYTKSTAVLMSLNALGSPYKLLRFFKFIPVQLRDWIYDFVARRRYQYFGKSNVCRLPTEAELPYFLE